MKRGLLWLAVGLIVGMMVALVVGAGWFAYNRATGSLVRLDNVRNAAESQNLVQTAPQTEPASIPASQGGGIVHTLLGFYLQIRAEDLGSSTGQDETIPFTVQPGETTAMVAARLVEDGLIRDAQLFRLYMRYQGTDRGLEAGDYQISSSMTIPQVAERLQQGRTREVMVTIPEGWRMEQIAAVLDQKSILPGQEFLALVNEGEFSSPFLSDRPPDVSLEGYLFPDTYRLPEDTEGSDLIERMLENFDRRVTPQMRQDAVAQGLSLFQIVTLASIVEREGVVVEELPLIASVYRNRLDQSMKLDADPTVQYAMGYQPDTGQWWKQPMVLEEYYEVDSPYNTYLYPGLPPGPICNPGIAAIKAAIYPAESDYLFFVRDDVTDDGSHVFARTLQEHERNRQLYQQ